MAKQAYIYYSFVKKKQGSPSSAIYEWQPVASDKWFPINRRNIVEITCFEKMKRLLHSRFIREIFNQMLQGHTVEVNGHYFKPTKTLCIDIVDFKIVKEVKW